MNDEKEIQEFLSKPPYFQMLSVLTSIQENIPENANESLLKIKKSLQEAICDYNSVLEKIQKQLIFDSDIYNLVFLLEHLSDKSIQTIISSLDDFSNSLAQKDFSSLSKTEKAMFITAINILKTINYFCFPIKNQNFKNLILDIIASTISLFPDNKIFFENMQNKLSDSEKSKGNTESIEFALSFYEKLNKVEQYFFTDSVLPSYIDNLFFVPEEILENLSETEREQQKIKAIAAEQLEYNILKFKYLQSR